MKRAQLLMMVLPVAMSTTPAGAQQIDIVDTAKLELVGVKADVVDYHGKKALRLEGTDMGQNGMAIIKGLEFHDGEIAVELAGAPRPEAPPTARGFVGMAFRIAGPKSYENIYLRPMNGRAGDQLQRNHSVQYESFPDYPWARLRKETPGSYETYVDLEPGVWTKYRLVIHGANARLYVHGSTQPTLIVNDLKLGDAKGAIALWIGPGTVGHFTGLGVKK